MHCCMGCTHGLCRQINALFKRQALDSFITWQLHTNRGRLFVPALPQGCSLLGMKIRTHNLPLAMLPCHFTLHTPPPPAVAKTGFRTITPFICHVITTSRLACICPVPTSSVWTKAAHMSSDYSQLGTGRCWPGGGCTPAAASS